MPDAANAVKPGAPIAEVQAPADLKKVAGDGKKKQGKAP
jgi:hypothetical protein